ncbi:MAG TPA: zinc-binding dehydrogenase [Bryobacteraceae bacterium]|nr:zinc-binding dehydrogenase [Bryobacteraceae bacterium]
MKAAVWKEKGRFDIEEVPVPEPAAGEVLIQIAYCGVCGTDIHRACTHGEIEPGVVIGHEYCGSVAAVGAGVTGWKEGDRVVCASGIEETGAAAAAAARTPGPRFTPRMVARTGKPGTLHQGGFAEYKRIRAANIVAVPDSVDDFTAALIEPCAVAVHANERAAVGPRDRVAILGLGPIGLLVAQVAKANGALQVYGADPSPVRRQAALDLGIDAVFDPRATDSVDAFVAATGGGPEVVIDCAAAPRTLDQALTAVRSDGRVVLVGISWDPVTAAPLEWIGRNVELRCMYAYSRAHCRRAMELIGAGAIGAPAMIRPEWTFPIDSIQQAFAQSLQAALVKAVIRL